MNVKDIKPDETMDARGLSCPMPILNTRTAMKKMKPGKILEVLATDEGFKDELPDFIKKTGNEWLGDLDDGEGFFRIYLKKT